MHELRSTLIRGERRGPLAAKVRAPDAADPSAQAAPKPGEGSLSGIRIKRQESRRCDQRREPRHIKVVEKAILSWPGHSNPVDVLNVSARGLMIQTELELAIGDRVAIRFSDCNPTDCFVRWLRDGRIGLEFARETLVIAPGAAASPLVSGRREGEHRTIAVKSSRPPRQGLMLNCEIHTAQGSMPGRLRNVSTEGAMIEAARDMEPLTQVVVEINGHAIAGRVRWCRARQMGIHFDSPFDVDRLAQPPAPKQATPGYLKPDYLRDEKGSADWASHRRLRPEDL